jgi:hypothetical protein
MPYSEEFEKIARDNYVNMCLARISLIQNVLLNCGGNKMGRDEKLEDMLKGSTRTPVEKEKPVKRSNQVKTDDYDEIRSLIKGLVPLFPTTAVEDDDDIEFGTTQGKRGKQMPKLVISMSTKNKKFVQDQSKARWITPSAFLNAMIDAAREESKKLNTIEENSKTK